MQVKFECKLLQSTTSVGEEKFWVARVVVDESGGVFTQSESWQRRASSGESKHVFSAPKRVVAKNVGRSNETTLLEQAVSEVESAFKKKSDSGYWPVGEGRPERLLQYVLPMLAHDGRKRVGTIRFPAYAQPKLDGCRALMRDGEAWSRKGLRHPGKIVEHIVFDTGGVVVDGELMLPLPATFQETMKAVKKYRVEETPRLRFYAFDVVVEGVPFEERLVMLRELVRSKAPRNVELVETVVVNSMSEAQALHDKWVAEGYEGLMLRNMSGLYKPKDRSADIIKHKLFDEEEFVITGVNEGSGKAEGLAVFECAMPDGRTFDVTPKGSFEYRRELWVQREELVGRKLTVKFQGYGDGKDGYEVGMPRFPSGKGIRDDAD